MTRFANILSGIYGLALIVQGVLLREMLSNKDASFGNIEFVIVALAILQVFFSIGFELSNKNSLISNFRFMVFGISFLVGSAGLMARDWVGNEIVYLVSILMIGIGAVKISGVFGSSAGNNANP